MDSPPRPLAGTDLAPCPDCGGDLTATVGEDTDGQWWDLDCPGCGWLAQEIEALAPFTLAGSPSTRALWAEVERLRRIKHDLDEENVQIIMAFNRRVVDAGLRVGLQKVGMDAKRCTVDDFVQEVETLRLELVELRLTLAAEQGRQEGAPSAGWEWDAHARGWARTGASLGWISVDHRSGGTWYADRHAGDTAPNMRAAMRAADEAEAQAAVKEPTP